MIAQTFTFKAKDKTEIFVYKWMPEKGIKGIVQIAHGIGEHGGRYENFARDLSNSGYMVYKTASQHNLLKTCGSLQRLSEMKIPTSLCFSLGTAWEAFC